MLPESKAFARMTAGGALWEWVFSRAVTPLYRHALSCRASGIASPYFADVSRGGKAESLILDPRFRKDDMELVVR